MDLATANYSSNDISILIGSKNYYCCWL
jgi:hypothetical protein